VLFILHADHEQNCSTSAMRGDRQLARRSRTRRWPARRRRSTGRCHGGANEAGPAMLQRDRHDQNIPASSSGEGRRRRLMGFGHRVYKSTTRAPRSSSRTPTQVFEVTGRNPLLDIALELERIALRTTTSSAASSIRTSISTRA
jgi:citrate synthase